MAMHAEKKKILWGLDELDRKYPAAFLFLCAFLMVLILECLSRHSMVQAILFLGHTPLLFLENVLLIQLTLSLSLLFSRRRFAAFCIAALWLALGITNFILLFFRITPFSVADFFLIHTAWRIATIYLKVWQLVLIFAAAAALPALLVFLGRRARHMPVRKQLAALCIGIAGAAFLVLTLLLSSAGAFTNGDGNIAKTYARLGFSTCFASSIFDRGIDEPDDYSEETIGSIVEGTESAAQTAIPPSQQSPEAMPNVIMVQLESFFDVNSMKGVSFSENPIPNFTALKQNFPHGYLTVPSFGAGTANTEFEVLTGMNIDYFGAVEYPYETVLQENTCETICYNLAENGYTCHAIHNHEGSFYDRDLVFSHLGFQTFTPLEYMQNVEQNPLGWAKDKILTSIIMEALSSTAQQDFIYTITVQPHGKYPDEILDPAQKIQTFGLEPEQKIPLEYYVNQLYESDAFIGALIQALSDVEEDTLLVLFGDHLPNLELTEENLECGGLFQTEYVLWANYDLEARDKDLYAYQLSAYVLELLGLDNGVLTKIHQNKAQEPDYQETLQLLEYDMLYGEQQSYDAGNPYPPTALHMGISEITLDSAELWDGRLCVRGTGFSAWSAVCMDGKALDTELMPDGTLLTEEPAPKKPCEITVAQIGNDGGFLSETAPILYRPPDGKQ